ncbi:MAG TPA: hypothetical protein VGF08_07785 [Terriglobales bacterium]
MKVLRLALLTVAMGAAVACSPRDFLTRRLAADLIASSSTFRNTQRFWIRTGVVSNQEYTSPDSLVLQHNGWITASNASCPSDVGPAPCWDVVLTPLGVDTLRDLIPGGMAQSNHFSVPVAKRQLTSITGIVKDETTAQVDFQWKWSPLNPVGSALYAGDVRYNSTVEFRHYDDGWRVVEQTSANPRQGLDDALKNAQAAQ